MIPQTYQDRLDRALYLALEATWALDRVDVVAGDDRWMDLLFTQPYIDHAVAYFVAAGAYVDESVPITSRLTVAEAATYADLHLRQAAAQFAPGWSLSENLFEGLVAIWHALHELQRWPQLHGFHSWDVSH